MLGLLRENVVVEGVKTENTGIEMHKILQEKTCWRQTVTGQRWSGQTRSPSVTVTCAKGAGGRRQLSHTEEPPLGAAGADSSLPDWCLPGQARLLGASLVVLPLC